MNDRAVALLEQYDVEILRTRKGRGVILCDTDKGLLVFKEYEGNEAKLALIDGLLSRIRDQGGVSAETLVPTREGALCVRENDGTAYILKTCCEGRECNIYDRGECQEAVRTLARLHQCMVLEPREDCPALIQFSPLQEYEKHNRELVKVQRFLRRKSQKSRFEYSLLGCMDDFITQAREVTEGWRTYEERMSKANTTGATLLPGQEEYAYCHGDYQYHNILWGSQGMYIVNFEKCLRDRQIRDLYLLMRKLLEKTDWSVALGRELMTAYGKITPISAYSYIDLYYRLSYPEKFWKIVNFYYNSGKAWIPQRNQEKLDKLLAQEQQKKSFLENVFQ
ncbi:MAG: phosphotransferase, partial [Acetatifactor sp.]|nr:phosphotransferase [Acetatifactor sp.]